MRRNDSITGYHHKYMLMSDSRFRDVAISELERMTGYKPIRTVSILDRYISIIDTDREIIGAYTENIQDNIFSYALIPLTDMDLDLSRISDLSEFIKGLLPKGRSFRIFVKNLIDIGMSQREAEISIGMRIESADNPVDLINPEVAVVVILSNTAMIGISSDANQNYAITSILHPKNTNKMSQINRSEVKLAEAIKYFGIGTDRISRCMDVGAAPGGWSDIMLRDGKRVIAIDSGLLDYKTLCRYGSVVIYVPDGEEESQALMLKIDSNIRVKSMDKLELNEDGAILVHIRSNANDHIIERIRDTRVDALLVDCNMTHPESTKLVLRLSELLSSKGILVFTIKINSSNVNYTINMTVDALSEIYSNIMVKKLVHNRREVTLFGIKM